MTAAPPPTETPENVIAPNTKFIDAHLVLDRKTDGPLMHSHYENGTLLLEYIWLAGSFEVTFKQTHR